MRYFIGILYFVNIERQQAGLTAVQKLDLYN